MGAQHIIESRHAAIMLPNEPKSNIAFIINHKYKCNIYISREYLPNQDKHKFNFYITRFLAKVEKRKDKR